MRLATFLFVVLATLFVFALQVLAASSGGAAWLWDALFRHPLAAAGFLVASFGGYLVFHKHVVLRLYGRLLAWLSPPTGLEPDEHGFPARAVDLMKEVQARPPGMLFVGLSPERRRHLPGWRFRPLYLSDKDRSAHRHVLGRTGSGKTSSVLWPQVLQDALDGRGVAVIDAKGSDENIRTLKAIARKAGREKDLRLFCLPAWNEPSLFSHAYNLVWVTPRAPAPTDPSRGPHADRLQRRGEGGAMKSGDPVAMAERVLRILPLGDNVYFNTQARIAFTNLCRLLHGMVDAKGYGLPFNLEDLAVCLTGVGANPKDDPTAAALDHCLDTSKEVRAAAALRSQLRKLGSSANECLSGLSGALESFQSPLINAYAPDLVFEEALERNQLLYLQLPTNLFKLQAPALGKAMLMDLQQAGALRQVFRQARNQRPFSVAVDEFGSFADLSIIESLNKLRDAHVRFTLAHQSLADLELVSPEFSKAVFDNCLSRDVLAQDNPELCEQICRSLGTWQRQERTVQTAPGPLFTEVLTGTGSSKLVDAYRLHPNAIKALPRCGQGYLLGAKQVGDGKKLRPLDGASPVCYPRLPQELVDGCDYPLKRNDQRRARGLRLYERFIARHRERKSG